MLSKLQHHEFPPALGIISVVVSLRTDHSAALSEKATPAATCSFLKQSRLGQGHLLSQGSASSLSLLHYILASWFCAVILPLHFILLAHKHTYTCTTTASHLRFRILFPFPVRRPVASASLFAFLLGSRLSGPSNQPEHRRIASLRDTNALPITSDAIFADLDCFHGTFMILRPTQHHLQASSPPLTLPSR